MAPKRLALLFLVLALLGFADAVYLSVTHYTNGIIPCSLTNGCETVLTSSYATMGPIPLALLGSAYYLALLVLVLLHLEGGNVRALRLGSQFSFFGALASLFLLYLQIFVIRALCLYCIGSALFSVGLAVLGFLILKRTAGAPEDATG